MNVFIKQFDQDKKIKFQKNHAIAWVGRRLFGTNYVFSKKAY